MAGGEGQPPSYLLDTNILVAYIRAGPLGEYIEETYRLRSCPYKPLICVVTVGEVFALARKWDWGTGKTTELKHLLRELIWVDVNNEKVLEAYVGLADFARTHRTVGQNDLWIAAAARTARATLLTTDKHFDQFHPKFIHRIRIDEDAVKARRATGKTTPRAGP